MLKVAVVLFLFLRLAGAATIRGAVVEQATGRPLARSLVTVSAVGPERSTGGSITTRANSSGLFFFSGLHPGGYVLTGSRKGFATRRYGQKNWKAAGTPILLPAEDSAFIVELRLQRLGAITGAVWDENQVGLPDQDVAVYDTTRPPKFLTKCEPTIAESIASENWNRAAITCERAGASSRRAQGRFPLFSRTLRVLSRRRWLM